MSFFRHDRLHNKTNDAAEKKSFAARLERYYPESLDSIFREAVESGNNFKVSLVMRYFPDNAVSVGLEVAAKNENMELVEYFLDHKKEELDADLVLAKKQDSHAAVAGVYEKLADELIPGLKAAMSVGNSVIAKKLIDFGARESDVSLEDACQSESYDGFFFALKNGASDYDAGLRSAASNGFEEISQHLLRLGATDVDGAIEAAAGAGQIQMIDLLSNLDKSKYTPARDFKRALVAASRKGKANIVRSILKKHVIENIDDAGVAASENGYADIAEIFLKRGDMLPGTKVKCIQAIIRMHHNKTFKHICKKHKKELGPYASTFIAEACSAGNAKAFKLLTNAFPDETLTQENIICACLSGNTKTVQEIIDLKYELPRDSCYFAVVSRNVKLLRLVFETLMPNATDILPHACKIGDVPCVRFLIKKGGLVTFDAIRESIVHENVDTLDYIARHYTGDTIDMSWFLSFAASKDYLGICKVIISKIAAPRLDEALEHACQNDAFVTARYLVTQGAEARPETIMLLSDKVLARGLVHIDTLAKIQTRWRNYSRFVLPMKNHSDVFSAVSARHSWTEDPISGFTRAARFFLDDFQKVRNNSNLMYASESKYFSSVSAAPVPASVPIGSKKYESVPQPVLKDGIIRGPAYDSKQIPEIASTEPDMAKYNIAATRSFNSLDKKEFEDIDDKALEPTSSEDPMSIDTGFDISESSDEDLPMPRPDLMSPKTIEVHS